MAKEITAVLIDVMGERCAYTVTFTDRLQSYYDLLRCETIDVVTRKIGDHRYNIVCDDEGLLKCDCILSAVNSVGKPMLVGNLIVLKSDDQGNFVSLNHNEIQEVINNTKRLEAKTGGSYIALICDY